MPPFQRRFPNAQVYVSPECALPCRLSALSYQGQCSNVPAGWCCYSWEEVKVGMRCHARRQWSWPINLPLPLLGIFGAKTLSNSGPDLPWSEELEHVSLAEKIGIAPYSEVSSSVRPHAMQSALGAAACDLTCGSALCRRRSSTSQLGPCWSLMWCSTYQKTLQRCAHACVFPQPVCCASS